MGRTLRAKRGVVTNMVGAELFRRKILAYEFDKASSMYATMPEWTPNGYSLEMSIQAHPLTVDGTLQEIFGNGTTGFAIRAPDNVIVFRYNDTTGTPIVIEGPVAVAGVTLNLKATADGTGVTLKVNDTDYPSAQLLGINQGNGFSALAGNPAGGAYFDGPMRRATIKDSSPIQAISAMMGDGSRYIEMPELVLGQGDDWEVTLDLIWPTGAGWTYVPILGNAVAGVRNYMLIYEDGRFEVADTTAGTAGGNYWDDTPLSSSVAGQHIRVRTGAVSGLPYLIVDDVDAGATVNNRDTFLQSDICTWDVIGYALGTNALPAEAAYQNVTLENFTTQEYICYAIDEGEGLSVKAYDRNGDEIPASAGTITPDADWQYIPSNSRNYPMNEGDGNTFADTIGGNDATIQNYNPDNWKYYPE